MHSGVNVRSWGGGRSGRGWAGEIALCSAQTHTLHRYGHTSPEPEFVNLLRSPGIESQPGGRVQQPYLTYRPTRLHTRLAESNPWNRFLCSLNDYKYGLRISCTATDWGGGGRGVQGNGRMKDFQQEDVKMFPFLSFFASKRKITCYCRFLNKASEPVLAELWLVQMSAH